MVCLLEFLAILQSGLFPIENVRLMVKTDKNQTSALSSLLLLC